MTINFFDLPIEAVIDRTENSSKLYKYKTINVLDGNKWINIERDTMNYPSFHIESWSPNMGYLIGESYADDHDELFLSGHYLVYKVVELNDSKLILEKMKIYRPKSITYKDKYAVLNGLSTGFSWELINLETFEKKAITLQKGWKSLKLDYIEKYDLYVYDRYKYENYIKTEVLNINYKNEDYEISFDAFKDFNFKLMPEHLVLNLTNPHSVEKTYKVKIEDLANYLKKIKRKGEVI